MLLAHILTEYSNLRCYVMSLKKLQWLIKLFLKVIPPCFAKIYHHTQILRKLRSTLDDYGRFLHLIQRSYLPVSYFDRCKARQSYSLIKEYSTNIGRVIDAFAGFSHATLCQDRVQMNSRHRHRSAWIYQYRFCGCFKDAYTLRNHSTRRWAKFCTI
ncbi:unnamed protein product [Rotaria socialis]|uniref:Uncharacterized protein n=1 Tax=Rotaria socialis TaxID=392032 RepID=A0A818AL88_9BILA|nr:unnamed protein product [Rotaria socialis]